MTDESAEDPNTDLAAGDDPLARPPHAIRRADDRVGADLIRHVLAEEGIPASVERDRRHGDWLVLVAEAAIGDSERALANREAMASGIDWDSFDPGEMSPRDARLLENGPRRLRIVRRLRTTGTYLLLLMILIGLLSMIADLLPSGTTNPGDSDTDTRLEQSAPETGVRDDETS
ncbi:MAG: hypothetical protein CMJ23_04365 [Phycisphaerae bacterium]|nr:hypothetical protein [Phycisphaerae bacterium]